jgi:hypothetical protein
VPPPILSFAKRNNNSNVNSSININSQQLPPASTNISCLAAPALDFKTTTTTTSLLLDDLATHTMIAILIAPAINNPVTQDTI